MIAFWKAVPGLESVVLFVVCLSALVYGNVAVAQTYGSIVVFGDSLSDTGNDAALSKAKYTVIAQVPGVASGYTDGRFTAGVDTTPAARNYQGVWVEQLAAKLAAHPAVVNSLSGGTNYAYGFATTAAGTSTLSYGPSNSLSISVNNMGQQVSDYLATRPTIPSNTLFVVWGGANDLLNAAASADIVNAVTRELALVQQLVAAGATDIVVPNLPPLGLIPRLNGSTATSVPATAAAQAFNQALAAGLTQLAAANAGRTLHLFPLDIYTLFNTIVGAPGTYGFTNVSSSSQGNTTANPDAYLFWDDLHPTTFGHSLIAAAAFNLLGTPVRTTVSLTSSDTALNAGSTLRLTANVSTTTGTAMGTATFLDGSTVLGSALVTGSNSVATATFSTSTLAAGTHTLTAAFAGVNGYTSGVSPTVTVVVTPPSFAVNASPASLSIARGSMGTSTISIVPSGGYVGTFTVACGTVPAHITCSVGTGSLSVTGSASASSVVTINTANVAANHVPLWWGQSPLMPVCAFLGLPMLAGISRVSRRLPLVRSASLFTALIFLSGFVVAMSGCGGSDPYAHDSPAGSYQVPVVVTPASGTATTVTLSVTVQ